MTELPASTTPPASPQAQRTVYTVSELNRQVKLLLEQSFPMLWIEGEISNFARPRSGHWYFSLKDAGAQVRCAMFRSRNALAAFQPQDGQQVLVRARIGLYEPRGDYQLIVEHVEQAGDGALRRAFDALKKRLQAEGLFEASRKRALPAAPRRIGLVTSPTGAALRDILSVLRRRYPLGRVLLYGVAVQGSQAPPAIVEALARAGRGRECDVLIVARGGGSLEDLWAFNEEAVARAIAACPVPVVSGVGHEIDFTIADFVADARAPTPSAAAELVSPDLFDWLRRMLQLEQRMTQRVRYRLQESRTRSDALSARLRRQHPGRRLEQAMQRLDELEVRLQRAGRQCHAGAATRLTGAVRRLHAASPKRLLGTHGQHRRHLEQRLRAAVLGALQQRRNSLGIATRTLHAVSPLATLARGYSIATLERADGPVVLRDASQASSGDRVHLRLHRGRLTTRVTGQRTDDD